ncbi:MAG: hypothetical protein P8125_09505 [Gemmatimonadota bacterium]
MSGRPPATGLSALWLAFTVAGFMTGFSSGFILAHLGPAILILPTCVGAAVGLAQRPVLRMFIERAEGAARWPEGLGGWVVGSAAGPGLAAVVAMVGNSRLHLADLGEAETWAVLVSLAALAGGLTGLAQSRILRRYLRRAAVWIPASAVSWATAAVSAELVPDRMGIGPFLLVALAGGLGMGLVSAATMSWLWTRGPRTATD